MFVCVGLDVFLCEVGCLLGARWVVWGGVCWLGGWEISLRRIVDK